MEDLLGFRKCVITRTHLALNTCLEADCPAPTGTVHEAEVAWKVECPFAGQEELVLDRMSIGTECLANAVPGHAPVRRFGLVKVPAVLVLDLDRLRERRETCNSGL